MPVAASILRRRGARSAPFAHPCKLSQSIEMRESRCPRRIKTPAGRPSEFHGRVPLEGEIASRIDGLVQLPGARGMENLLP
jgi:hypothetical protein